MGPNGARLFPMRQARTIPAGPRRAFGRRETALVLALAGSAGCGPGAETEAEFAKAAEFGLQPALPRPTHPAPDAGLPHDPRLPAFTRYFPPSQEPDLAVLSEVDRCVECHRDIVRQWRDSPHARASFDNPWYRASVDAYREAQGRTASRFCAGCHDPLLLASNAMDEPVLIDTPHATAGVTCLVCHGIVESEVDGRGSFTLRSDSIPYPTPGNDESLRAHRARLASTALRSTQMCGSCHRAHLDQTTGNAHFLKGMDDLGAYASSGYAGSHAARLESSVAPQDCSSCHMPAQHATREGAFSRTGQIRSHRMPGGQTALASQTSVAQLDATRAQLRSAAVIDIGAVRLGDGTLQRAPTTVLSHANETVTADVVLSNTRAGHQFPGGVRDTQHTWVEVVVEDAHGCAILSNGASYQDAEATPSQGPVHTLFTAFVDDAGEIELRHQVDRFAAMAFDHTVAPLDSRAVRYRFTIPAGAGFPLTVRARLLHQRHNHSFQEFACDQSRTSRGRRFSRLTPDADPCAAQPVTEISSTSVLLATAGTASNHGAQTDPQSEASPRWLRLYRHALALSHQLSEHLGETEASLTEAASLAPTFRDRAQVLVLRAEVEAKQGRREHALEFAQTAEQLLRRVARESGEQVHGLAAVFRARGQAHDQVWDFDAAVQSFRNVVARSPRDTQAHRDLARALGSAGQRKGALLAARAGLRLNPRDSQLLRTQALALRRLHGPGADEAHAQALAHREPDAESEARRRCVAQSETCRTALVPVPTLFLKEHACAQ